MHGCELGVSVVRMPTPRSRAMGRHATRGRASRRSAAAHIVVGRGAAHNPRARLPVGPSAEAGLYGSYSYMTVLHE